MSALLSRSRLFPLPLVAPPGRSASRSRRIQQRHNRERAVVQRTNVAVVAVNGLHSSFATVANSSNVFERATISPMSFVADSTVDSPSASTSANNIFIKSNEFYKDSPLFYNKLQTVQHQTEN